jgi:enoyl-CoA hydratase/carnithine racemase
MIASMRQSTLDTMGLGSVLEVFKNGRLPVDTAALVERVFGPAKGRGSLVISGANGIVGAGKAMQFGSRLEPFGVRIVALDFPGAPDGIGRQYQGLLRAFGQKGAAAVMDNIIRLTYDGSRLPETVKEYRPRFLLEAIPEILELKKAHYEIFRAAFPDIQIRSVTSGFPNSQLGVGIAHPAFPHEINKVWEIVESEPSDITHLLLSLGLIPIPVSDDWSFVLDVLFCGLTLAGLRYHRASNMPFWKLDKYIRRLMGPNPFRAHDAIGAKGANFLTWSCLHHLSIHYGELFTPTRDLDERKDSGQNWYPMNHFRPLVNWSMEGADEDEFNAWILGAIFQMTSLLLHEKRAHLAHLNIIGELCAQFRSGVIAAARALGPDAVIGHVKAYQKLHPAAAKKCWYPKVFERMDGPEWQQLYVNAEHDGTVGTISIGRESYNRDVNAELNRAIDWLKAAGIERVIVTGDFHLSTQMIGADTSDFFPALEDETKGLEIATSWSATARRLNDEFKTSIGFINGKRCLGGFLELLMHCHYLVSVKGADVGMPEVTLPVVPGMEGCHWPFRKAKPEHWPKLLALLLEGKSVKAEQTAGWLVDYAGSMDEALAVVWKIATDGDHKLARRKVATGALKAIPKDAGALAAAADAGVALARQAIFTNIQHSCKTTLADAITVQAKHSAGFMASQTCRKGAIGAAFTKTMTA